MTNTQTKVAALTKRVERIERALASIETLANPMIPLDAPVSHEAWANLQDIIKDIRAEKRG